jgi:hypothetical protein
MMNRVANGRFYRARRVGRALMLMLVPLFVLVLLLGGMVLMTPGATVKAMIPESRLSGADFQTVTHMENALYQRTYEQQALPERLSRIERSMFGRHQPQWTAVRRVQRLTNQVQTIQQGDAKKESIRTLRFVETRLFGLPTVSLNDDVAQLTPPLFRRRLDRVEQALFGQRFDDWADSQRLAQIQQTLPLRATGVTVVENHAALTQANPPSGGVPMVGETQSLKQLNSSLQRTPRPQEATGKQETQKRESQATDGSNTTDSDGKTLTQQGKQWFRSKPFRYGSVEGSSPIVEQSRF